MPRHELMNWDAKNKRWRKQYGGSSGKGPRFVVSCKQLGTPATREGSYQAANEWWKAKVKELEQKKQREREAKIPATLLEAIELRKRLLQTVQNNPELQSVQDLKKVVTILEKISTLQVIPENWFLPNIASTVRPDENIREIGTDILEEQFETGIAAVDNSLAEKIKQYLALYEAKEINGNKSIHRRRGIDKALAHFKTFAGSIDVTKIDSNTVDNYYIYLSKLQLSESTKSTYYGIFKQFLKYLYHSDVIPYPKSLDKRLLSFGQSTPKKNHYDNDTLKNLLKGVLPEQKLHILLALNCGFYPVDISNLRHDQFDETAGTITHKRVKTRNSAHAPIVTYKLWPQTLELLLQQRHADNERMLLTNRGTPFVDGNKDIIGEKFKRFAKKLGIAGSFGDLRNTSATRLEAHNDYSRHGDYFLGHAGKSMREKHYAAKDQASFDEAIGWLREQYGF